MPYRIVLEKENFKFSCSHFTIFGRESCERLHGHNYYVSAEFSLDAVTPELGMAFDFNELKTLVREVTQRIDEFVLLPAHSPYLKLEHKANSVRAAFAKKQYEFPKEDVQILPIVNITSEELAKWIAKELKDLLKARVANFASITRFAVGVQETRGQSVYFETEMA
jgi:6-pyruvoyltetrahydropterin/6-carboxytetrahydropterin synthase